jgi:hypothetical protein
LLLDERLGFAPALRELAELVLERLAGRGDLAERRGEARGAAGLERTDRLTARAGEPSCPARLSGQLGEIADGLGRAGESGADLVG